MLNLFSVMKFFSFAIALGALTVQAVVALPSGKIFKRADINETPSFGYAAGSTTGGVGGTTVTVTTLDELIAAVEGSEPKIIFVDGEITGNDSVHIGSNKSVLGNPGASLTGVGLQVNGESNVIIRNLVISKVLAEAKDAIGIRSASNVWVDHLELFSDRDHSDRDFYDGLLDVTHRSFGVTLSHIYLHDHYKGSLVGADDSNTEDIDTRVTYAYNYWKKIGSRTPSFRFGQGHIYNSFFEDNDDGINSRIGAQLLVENNVFSGVVHSLFSTNGGGAVSNGNDFGEGGNTASKGNLTSVPYEYDLWDTSDVVANVQADVGATLTW